MNLKGSKVLLTGGSSGIGLATAKALQEKGANVLISGRDKAKLIKAADSIGCKYILMDSSNFDEIEGQCKEAVDMLGGIDVLINNAGIGTFDLIDDISLEDFLNVYNTNVFGVALISQQIIKHFKAAEERKYYKYWFKRCYKRICSWNGVCFFEICPSRND